MKEGIKEPYQVSLSAIHWEVNWELPKIVGSGGPG